MFVRGAVVDDDEDEDDEVDDRVLLDDSHANKRMHSTAKAVGRELRVMNASFAGRES